jgi:hypothetical protein
MAKSRPPIVRSVRTPEALAALRAWLATFDERTRQRGEVYYQTGKVEEVYADADHFVEAAVAGQELYEVTLFLTRGKWSSHCTCPMMSDCKHVYAAGLAWMAEVEAGGARPTNLVPVPPAEPPLPVPPKTRALTFRERWTPVLEKKLGRSLSDAEGRQLGELSALFTEFTQAYGTLRPDAIRRHGFQYTLPPGAFSYTPAFAEWWDHASAPADPWELWQYLAFDYERHGREIPEVFRPLTNTSAVQTAVADRLVQQELAVWRRALAATEAGPGPINPIGELAGLRARVGREGGLFIETRAAPGKPWKPPTLRWLSALTSARPADFEHLSPAEAALGLALVAECRLGIYGFSPQLALPPDAAAGLLRTTAARSAIVLPDERPFTVEPEPLVPEATVSATVPQQLDVRLVAPDGRDATGAPLIARRPEPLYLFDGRVWRGPPPPPSRQLPFAALADPHIMRHLRTAGLRLPAALEAKVRRVALRPLLRCWLGEPTSPYEPVFFKAELLARSDDPVCEQCWCGAGGWQWTRAGAPPPRRPDDPMIEFDLTAAQAVSARFADFRLQWHNWDNTWSRSTARNFPEEFVAWHATLPPGLAIETSPELAGLLGPPLRARVEFSAAPAGGGNHDWFDLTVALRVEDTTLTPGGDRAVAEGPRQMGQPAAHRLAAARTRRRPRRIRRRARPARPRRRRCAGDRPPGDAPAARAATRRRGRQLREPRCGARRPPARSRRRPREPPAARPARGPARHAAALSGQEGFHFSSISPPWASAACSPTTWASARPCRPSPGCCTSEGRRAPRRAVSRARRLPEERDARLARRDGALRAVARPRSFVPALARTETPPGPASPRSSSPTTPSSGCTPRGFGATPGTPSCSTRRSSSRTPAARSPPWRGRCPRATGSSLTGTPIENRLLDLWSLFAFAQPGAARHAGGVPPAVRRRRSRGPRPAAPARAPLSAAAHQGAGAPDLPPRTEDEIVVELEGGQRRLYDAELKRARAQLLGISTDRALDAVRFNVLASLLRLRQICCHPALVDPAHRELPSAKLDALARTLEELRDEGTRCSCSASSSACSKSSATASSPGRSATSCSPARRRTARSWSRSFNGPHQDGVSSSR